MHAFRRLREQEAEAQVLAATAPVSTVSPPVKVAEGDEGDEPKRRRVSRRSEATATEN
jgi:hypothetical protein